MDHEQYIQAVLLGRVLTRAIMGVEPFSGNALYYPRRTGTMEQYKTVKEVYALCARKGYAASVSQLTLATAAQYFQL